MLVNSFRGTFRARCPADRRPSSRSTARAHATPGLCILVYAGCCEGRERVSVRKRVALVAALMATSTKLVDAVRTALSDGTASSCTVATLQSLLCADGPPQKLERRPGVKAEIASTKERVTKLSARKVATKPPIPVLEDAPQNLPPKARHALATDVVNVTLKVLAAAAKPDDKASKKGAALSNWASSPGTPRTPSRASPGSPRALQPRSGNATPKRARATKASMVSSDSPTGGPSAATVATAECARLAFACLRSINMEKLGVRKVPGLVLETGTLALIARLLALRLEALAIKELRIVKRRLQNATRRIDDPSSSLQTSKRSKPLDRSEKETLASLLQLDPAVADCQDVLPLAITYQQLVLKVIVTTGKPAVIEEAVHYLSLDCESSPANFMKRQGQHDVAKTAKQLEMLAQTLLSPCPGVSTQQDSVAVMSCHHANPSTVFDLQVLALRVRQTWWRLAEHKADYGKELTEPFSKCLAAFARRSTMIGCATGLFAPAQKAFTQLGISSLSGTAGTSFNICRTLAHLAESEDELDGALRWTAQMVRTCEPLEPQNARGTASLVRQASLMLKAATGATETDDIREKLKIIITRLRSQLTGHTADYDLLLTDLAQLVRLLTKSVEEPTEYQLAQELLWLAAGFAQRYARSYPSKDIPQTQAILYGALRHSNTTESLSKWITRDAVSILIRNGNLQAVAEAAGSKPLSVVWSISRAALATDRVLHALSLKAAKAGADESISTAYDDETLAPTERGVLLERQLMYAVELADRPKYHTVLQQLVQGTFQRLFELYTAELHPIRRARVAVIALQLRERHPGLLPPHCLQLWLDASPIDAGHLAEDKGLKSFLESINADLEVTQAFHKGKPVIADLKPALLVWQRIIEEATSRADIEARVDRPEVLALQLKAIASYFSIMGVPAARLPVLRMLFRLQQLRGASSNEQVTASIDLAQQYLELGFSEKAGHTLAEAHKLDEDHSLSPLARLQFHVAHAHYLIAIDNIEKTRDTLLQSEAIRTELPPEKVARGDRKAYELIHAQRWLIQSRLCLRTGAPHEALAAAKSAVKLLGGAWASIERSMGSKVSKATTDLTDNAMTNETDAVTGLAAGVSKLKLTVKDEKQPDEEPRNENGAAFWSVLPIMRRALLRLSDMYAHHGLFPEADYYSTRAVSLAEAAGADAVTPRIMIHRSRLLTLAGRLEEAELCLTKIQECCHDDNEMTQIEYSLAKAAIRAKEGSYEEASGLYQKAVQMLRSMLHAGFVQSLERFTPGDEPLPVQNAALPVTGSNEACESSTPQTVAAKPGKVKSKRVPASKAATKTTASRGAQGRKAARPGEQTTSSPGPIYHLLDQLKATILLEHAMVTLHLGGDAEASEESFEQVRCSMSCIPQRRRVQFQQLMCKAVTSLQFDMSYSMLPESTLSFPALVRADRRLSEHGAPRSSLLSGTVAPAKPAARKKSDAENVASLLLAARECLASGHSASLQISSTAEAYRECSMLSNVSMLLSAAGPGQIKGSLHPVREALHIEQPRMNALRCEAQAILLDTASSMTAFAWPEGQGASALPSITAAAFQDQYIDILPKCWTAVSLSLNEDCSELYVARYRTAQSPLILRLPFSRHKQEDDDQQVFDYHTGKAELQDIIQTSNYSCHNTGKLEAKGAKSNWWSEREALDKRLHELLLNVENIWFGGFKGAFSQFPRQPDLLARFRKSMEDVLARYLPSRQTAKGRVKHLSLDDKVLELFIGLGTDQDGAIDLDEPIADLLYFVVDMLQFNGERNAYDEIDFDGMSVDVLDALRSYHEVCPENNTSGQHLILVLDKRLQAFPWESLPCLESASVSRVGSMLSIRQRVLAMREQGSKPGCYMVGRNSGSYILNPSSDLANTQTTLLAPLSKLAEAEGARWTSMVQQVPSEDEYRTALTESSMLLYFGHGSGAQYIRPRTIRKLEKCSEVVWLMGCSSGAVTEYGELEPSAVPLAYLMAGQKDGVEETEEDIGPVVNDHNSETGRCMAVVATLWDVTDKDIDRFSLAMGEAWGLWPVSQAPRLPSKTPRKRDQLVAPATPQQAPKTPKARKTPAPAKTPARSRSRPRQEDARKRSLVEAVAKSRDACYLRYLNGAAPVVYGLPVYLGD